MKACLPSQIIAFELVQNNNEMTTAALSIILVVFKWCLRVPFGSQEGDEEWIEMIKK